MGTSAAGPQSTHRLREELHRLHERLRSEAAQLRAEAAQRLYVAQLREREADSVTEQLEQLNEDQRGG